jgi:prepilin-type N-terminal cleavage/methylation domain-containing protein
MKDGYAKGFTLVEMMVAMAIGSIVLLLGAVMLGSAGDGYARLSGGVSGEREARALLSQLSADLATARWHADTLFERKSGDWAADRVGFLTLQAPDAQSDAGRIGDLCAAWYYIKDMPVGGRVVRCLMRGVCESDDTLSAVRGGSVGGLFVPTGRDEPVAFGVVAFEARPKVRNAGGRWEDWQKISGAPPDAVEVRLVVARREAMARLVSVRDWDGMTEQAKKILGDPAIPQNNPRLAVYGGVFHFGNEACR